MTPLERAIKIIGSSQALADALGLKTAMAVSHWKTRKQIPSKHILTITELTGVPSHELLRSPDHELTDSQNNTKEN